MKTKIRTEHTAETHAQTRKAIAYIFIVLGVLTLVWLVGIVFIIMGVYELHTVKKLVANSVQLECECPYCNKTIFVYKNKIQASNVFICPICGQRIYKNDNYLERV